MVLHAQLTALSERHDVTLVAGVGDEPWEPAAARALGSSDVHEVLADRRRSQHWRGRMRRRAQLAIDWTVRGDSWRALWFAAPQVQLALDHLAAVQPFDVITVEDYSMGLMRFPAHVPSVLTEHEVNRAGPGPWKLRSAGNSVRWAVRGLDWHRAARAQGTSWKRHTLLQVFTEQDAMAVRQREPEVSAKVRVNPFGIALPTACDPNREQTDSILFSGNFTHAPNVDAARWLVREILPRVWKTCPEARLRVVGTAPPREVIELAGDGVEVLADVPSVDPYLQTAAVCLAPIRLGGGMRMKVLQALAVGKAVVTTRRGAEGFTQAGCQPPMIVRDDSESIALATIELLRDPERRRRLGASAREYAERFHSPSAWGARLEEVYVEACRLARSGC
jgi:glycosyltransferase involved in cell wall biosynthesis